MYLDFDLRPLIWLATIGAISTVTVFVVGSLWLIDFLIYHVRII